MKYILNYIIQAARLLKQNIGTLLVFELLYKFSLITIFKPVTRGLLRLALHLQGISYLSDETFLPFVKAPSSWLFLILIVLVMAFFTLWDICCIIICFHASYHKQKVPLVALIQKGLKTALRITYQRRNILMIVYLLIIIPMTQAILMAGYVAEFSVPQFILDFIMSHFWLRIAYVAFWVFMGIRTFNWLYGLHYYCLEGCDFKVARRRSFRLMDGHYIQDLIAMVCWNASILAAYSGIIFLGSWLISRVNQVMQNYDMFCSLTLSGISLLLNICGAVFYIVGLPLVFTGVSLLFYYRKKQKHFKIAPAFDDLEERFKMTETQWVRKLYQNRKRIIAICVVAVIAVNFVYSFGEKKGFLSSGIQQEVEVTAHRGYSEEYPENTIPAFKGAIEIGADWIELDVQETADGEVIIMHDSNLKRTTGQDLNIWEVNYAEIKDLDNGSWFNRKYKEIKIPTFEQVLKVTQGKIRLNVEIKPTGHEKNLEKQVVELLQKYHMDEYCVVSSMKYESLEKVKQYNPEQETVYITSVSYGNYNVLDAADGYSVESTLLTDSFVKQAHRANKKVYVWTINSEDTLSKVVRMGIDNVITDDPVMAQKLIYEEGHLDFWDRYIDRLLRIREQ